MNPADQMIDPAKQTKNFNPLWRSIFSGEIRNYRGYADRVSTYIARVL